MVQSKYFKMECFASFFVLLLTSAWLAAAANAMYWRGDSVIGLHPTFLVWPFIVALLVLLAVLALILRNYRFAVVGMLCVALMYTFFSYAYMIERWAWWNSIRMYDDVNKMSITKSKPIIQLADEDMPQKIAEDDALTKLNGFRWYCRQPVSAPGGVFRAFRYQGVVHVRIQKTTHGFRGIALVDADDAMDEMARNNWLEYEYENIEGMKWAIWKCK